MAMKNWLFDEFIHCGVDYSSVELAAFYDQQHNKFRNYETEFNEMLAFLGIQDTDEKDMIDLGCGTGAITCVAAAYFRNVFAVDVSNAMLDQAKKKLNLKQANVTFINAGFLTYEHAPDPVDLVVSKAALHHLPDFWKQIALLRINKMLKPDGLLYIHDVIFRFDLRGYADQIDAWIAGLGDVAGENFKREAEIHIKDEYSTFDWVMEEMLTRAGFSVEGTRIHDALITEYACRKLHDADANLTA
jgi:putative AdoMet-dependent methyltransferase